MSTKAENVRLIATDPESGGGEGGSQLESGASSSSSSSWSSWGKVAAGAGVLAVLGAAATYGAGNIGGGGGGGGVLASLGLGLELPPIPTAAETAAIVGAGGVVGGVDEAAVADFASAPQSEVVEAVLGRSHATTYHHGSKTDKDDKNRDKAYIVPPIVVEKLAARLGGKHGKKSSKKGGKYTESLGESKGVMSLPGEIAETKGKKADVLNTPVYIVAMEESTKDAQRVAEMLEKMVRLHGSEAVGNNVHITPGMNVAAWPKKIELAEYAIKCVIEKRTKAQIAGLPWIETYASRNDKGQLGNPSAREFPMSHHIGCLYAHMYDWQMATDAGYKQTIIFESDAVDPSLLGVPLSSIQSIVNEAPKEFDLIFLTKRPVGGKLAKKFKDPLGTNIHLYHLTEQNEEAGLSSYIISDTFFKKMQRYIIAHGADMVDAWLSAKMCVKPAFDKHGNFVSFDGGGGKYRYLNCYHAAAPGFRSEVSPNFPH